MLMLGAETIFVINPSLYSRLPYAVKDFAPITGLVRANQALLAHPGFAPKSVGELIALAKEKPGTIQLRHRRASAPAGMSMSRCSKAWRA